MMMIIIIIARLSPSCRSASFATRLPLCTCLNANERPLLLLRQSASRAGVIIRNTRACTYRQKQRQRQRQFSETESSETELEWKLKIETESEIKRQRHTHARARTHAHTYARSPDAPPRTSPPTGRVRPGPFRRRTAGRRAPG